MDSPHVTALDQAPSADAARAAVEQVAAASDTQRLEPVQALNAQPVDLGKTPAPEPPAGLTTEEVFPPQLVGPDTGLPTDPTAAPVDPTAPPPVPPPMMPPQ